jgi:hypothetical protein
MKARLKLVALAIMCVCTMPAFAVNVKAVPAMEQTTVVANPLENIQVDVLVDGIASTATMTITGFANQGKTLLAVASLSVTTITGIITETVLIPATVTGTCSILDLHLGAISLDLLGLQVDLAAVDLDIVAESGPGKLLGNLLCAVTNLLNSNAAGNAITRLVGLLNEVVAAL